MDVFSRRQRAVGMFITNVPGPPSELTLDGARLLRAVPLSIIAGNIRISVAALSYAGVITVTSTFDSQSCPDAQVFADALGRGLQRASAGRSGAPMT
jgi:diacylglycerol O-acyltransferase